MKGLAVEHKDTKWMEGMKGLVMEHKDLEWMERRKKWEYVCKVSKWIWKVNDGKLYVGMEEV